MAIFMSGSGGGGSGSSCSKSGSGNILVTLHLLSLVIHWTWMWTPFLLPGTLVSGLMEFHDDNTDNDNEIEEDVHCKFFSSFILFHYITFTIYYTTYICSK